MNNLDEGYTLYHAKECNIRKSRSLGCSCGCEQARLRAQARKTLPERKLEKALEGLRFFEGILGLEKAAEFLKEIEEMK